MSAVVIGLGANQRVVRLARLLPCPGEVLVSRGRVIRQEEIVARAEPSRWPFTLPVAALLGEEGKDVSSFLLKRPGEEVAEGEVVAAKRGLFGRTTATCRCPVAGMVLDFRAEEGLLVVRPIAEVIAVAAALAGRVSAIVPERGVTIETPALLLQALAMSGGESYGPLQRGSDEPGGRVGVDARAGGSVLFGGWANLETLQRAQAAGVKAVVAGSVTLEGWQAAVEGAFPGLAVLPVESLGEGPMAGQTFAALCQALGRPALVLLPADQGQCPLRPQVIVCLQAPAPVEPPPPRLEVGAQVRIAAGGRCGLWGRVASLSLSPRQIAGTIASATADVTLEDGSTHTFPLANLELAG
ncbi:MAG: hypothetical protein M1401_02095 [Chloroflexi bacterium]|nr:hypothetical protein [Chloroflexota bacterium]MCL5107670.1 hypothetical protein [Chloroflexota bacterium]